MRFRVAACLLVLAASGCGGNSASRSTGDNPFGSATDRPSRIRIEVQNLNFADARLYAVSAGARRSLGTVGGKADQSFTLDWSLNEDLQIEINMLAGPTCVTQPLDVQPGDILELQIQSRFTQSAFCR